jgi:AraC-like DNA-binding protein
VSPSPLFTFRAIPIAARLLALAKKAPAGILEAAGLPASGLSGDVTAPVDRISAFMDACARALDEPLFGIKLARLVPAGSFGFAEFVARTAPTFGKGAVALAELGSLINPCAQLGFAVEKNVAILEYTVRGRRAGLGRQLNEYTLALIMKLAEEGMGSPLPTQRVWLPHPIEDHRDALEAAFNCRVDNGPTIGWELAASALNERPRLADEGLFRFLSEQARALLARTGSDDIVARLIRTLEDRLGEADDIDVMARSLGMTARTLQRHLRDAGTSFRAVLDHVRHRRYAELDRAGLPVKEISTRLGFAELSSLRRARTRWTAG